MDLDRCCDEVKTTTLFVMYLYIVNQVLSRGVDPVWTDSELKKVEVEIAKFRR